MSDPFTADQALEMARAFKKSALAIGRFTIARWQELSPAERKELNHNEWKLFHASEDLINRASKLELDDLEKSLKSIVSATEKANRAVKNVTSVKKAVSIAASLVALADAVMSKSPSATARGLRRVYDELKA